MKNTFELSGVGSERIVTVTTRVPDPDANEDFILGDDHDDGNQPLPKTTVFTMADVNEYRSDTDQLALIKADYKLLKHVRG